MVVVTLVIPMGSSLSKIPCHSPRCSEWAHLRTHQLARPRLWSSMMGLMVVVASQSKSHQNVKKSSKSWKTSTAWKFANVIGLEESSSLTSDTRLAITKMRSSLTKLTIENYWPSLKSWKTGGTFCQLQAQSSCPYQLSLRRFRDTKGSRSRQVCWA